MHRVHKKSHFFLRDEALLVPIKNEEAELQHLRDLEEAVGGHGGHEFPEIDTFGVGRLDEVEQPITKNGPRHEDDLVVEVRDGYDGSSLLVVLLEHVPEHADVLLLRAVRVSARRQRDANASARSHVPLTSRVDGV